MTRAATSRRNLPKSPPSVGSSSSSSSSSSSTSGSPPARSGSAAGRFDAADDATVGGLELLP
eukprot:29150-Pelagococcus_subviridis.AAC.4